MLLICNVIIDAILVNWNRHKFLIQELHDDDDDDRLKTSKHS